MLLRQPRYYSCPLASFPHSLKTPKMLRLQASRRPLPSNPSGPLSNRNKRGSKTRNAARMFVSVAIGGPNSVTIRVTAPRAEATTTVMIARWIEI